MIRLFLCFLLLVGIEAVSFGQTASNNTFEQTDKGSHLAGGTISVSNQFSNSTSTNAFAANLNPNYGYFFANNLAIGGVLSLAYSKQEAGPSSQNAILSPFVRYYIGPPRTFMIFGYASAGGGINVNQTKNVGLFDYKVGAGADYFVNKHVAFEALLTYDGNKKLNIPGADYTSIVGLLIGLQVFF